MILRNRRPVPANALFLGLSRAGKSVYMTNTGIMAKWQRKPPWHTTIVCLLVELYGISRADYEEYRQEKRELAMLFADPRLACYPTWMSLATDGKYRFRPVGRYFIEADEITARCEQGGQA